MYGREALDVVDVHCFTHLYIHVNRVFLSLMRRSYIPVSEITVLQGQGQGLDSQIFGTKVADTVV